MKAILTMIMVACLFGTATANVGVVVEFPDGEIYTECVDIEDADGYEVMEASDLDLDWSHYSGMGYSLDEINGVGPYDPETGRYWNLYEAINSDSWDFASVGVSSLTFNNGDRIGWIYTTYGSEEPKEVSFDDICVEKEDDKGPRQKKILMSSRPFWKDYCRRCGIEYNPELGPQMLRQLCHEKQSTENATNSSASNDTNKTGHIKARPTKVSFDYSPKKIKDFRKPFTVRFFNGDMPLKNLTVMVNGEEHRTNSSGIVSFDINMGDYLVKFSNPGYELFRRIFRIGA
jgi:hypothetical protein